MYDTCVLEERFEAALSRSKSLGPSLFAALDQLPAPVYVTDANGFVVHFNLACADFAGRRSVVGEDRWCVTWKLYTDDGQFLPHDACPRAEAIHHKRPLTGVAAVAERPDGTRVRFMPYPVPFLGADGELVGAVNMLIDISDGRQARFLRRNQPVAAAWPTRREIARLRRRWFVWRKTTRRKPRCWISQRNLHDCSTVRQSSA